eukprot:scaffold86880_cov51-Attheya_sp.AAC.2
MEKEDSAKGGIGRKKKIIVAIVVSVTLMAVAGTLAFVFVSKGDGGGGGDGSSAQSNQSSGNGGSSTGSSATALPTLIQATSPPTIKVTTDPTASPAVKQTAAPTVKNFKEFNFILMGDTPYTNKDRFVLQNQLFEIGKMVDDQNANPDLPKTRFIMHVGDIQIGKNTDCVESEFTEMQQDIINFSPLPFLLIQGDNDWNDCPNPAQAKLYHDAKFIGIETDLKLYKTTADRSYDLPSTFQRYPYIKDNFSMDVEGVLMLSVNLIEVDSMTQNQFDSILQRDAAWTTSSIQNYINKYGEQPRAVIIFGHPMRRQNIRSYFETIAPFFHWPTGGTKYDCPVVYVHGDGHNWLVDTQLQAIDELYWENFWDIQCDQGGHAAPLTFEFRGSNDPPFTLLRFDQFVIKDGNGEGIIRIDRRGGLYAEQKVFDPRYPWPPSN